MINTAQKPPAISRRDAIWLSAAAFLAALAVAGLWYVKVRNPITEGIFPPCLFREVTGLYCTGCGMTRALHYLMNGHFYAAFRMNPLAVASLPALIWITALTFWRLYRRKPLPNIPLWVPWAIVAVVLLYTVARNLPWMPFQWLAPTQVG